MAKRRATDEDGKAASGFSRAGSVMKRKKTAEKSLDPVEQKDNSQNNTNQPRRVGRPRSARPTMPMTVALNLSDDELLSQTEPTKIQSDVMDVVENIPRKVGRRPKSVSSTPKPLETDDKEPLVQNGTTFVEPELRNDKIVTGQPLDEPPNMFAKRELNLFTKKRGPKPKAKSPSPNDDALDEKVLKQYSRKLSNLNKIEKSTKLSSERNGRGRPKGANGSKRSKNGDRDSTSSPPPSPPREHRGKLLTSPVKKPKNSRRLVDLSQHLSVDDDDNDDETKEITPDLSTTTVSTLINQDYCSCCGLPGMFLCCETCPRSFHFHCLNPPMDPNELPDRWFCRKCIGEKTKDQKQNLNPNVGILDKLLTNIAFENPISFKLPREIVETFQGISMDRIGDFEDDSFKEEKSYKELVKEMEDPLNGILDVDGNPFICYKCDKSKSDDSSDIMKCDYCPLSWHLDCLDPPVASVKKLGSKWKCPNHADSIIKLRRKMHNQPILKVDSTKITDIPSDSHIDIANIDDRIYQFKDDENELIYSIPNKLRMIDNKLKLGNVTYELKEEDIILDFLKGAKIKRIGDNNNNINNNIRNLEPNIKNFVASLSKLSDRPIVSDESKRNSMRDLLNIVNDEIKIENGVGKLSNDELKELLIIKRLMEKKGKGKLLNFLKSND